MTKTAKILLGLGVLGGAGVGGYFYLKRRAEELVIVPEPRIHSLDGTGLTIRVGATFKNPTGFAIEIKYPFIKVKLNNVQIGTSKLRDEIFDIPAYGEKALPEPIEIKFTLFELSGLLPKIWDLITKQEPLGANLTFEIKTPVKVPLGFYIPVKSTTELSV